MCFPSISPATEGNLSNYLRPAYSGDRMFYWFYFSYSLLYQDWIFYLVRRSLDIHFLRFAMVTRVCNPGYQRHPEGKLQIQWINGVKELIRSICYRICHVRSSCHFSRYLKQFTYDIWTVFLFDNTVFLAHNWRTVTQICIQLEIPTNIRKYTMCDSVFHPDLCDMWTGRIQCWNWN